MGNANSIHIDTPTSAISRSVLRGSVAVNIGSPPKKADTLSLQLTGLEHGHRPSLGMHFGLLGSMVDNGVFFFEGVKESMVLSSFSDGLIPPGQYVFPFELTLPALPGSFSYWSLFESMYLRYFLTASLSKGGKDVLTVKRALEILPHPAPQYDLSLSFKATSGCCWKRDREGVVHLSVSVDKSSYKPGEIVKATIRYSNTTDVKPEKLNLCVDHNSTSTMKPFYLGTKLVKTTIDTEFTETVVEI